MGCIFEIGARQRLSFSLTKSPFFPTQITFVGVDIRKYYSYPEKKKYELLKTWPVPANVRAVAVFIAFRMFYMKWIPYYEVKITLLHMVCNKSHWDTRISPQIWTLFLTRE